MSSFQPIRILRRFMRAIPVTLGAEAQKDGVITLLDESRLPASAVVEANNMWQMMDARFSTRPGTAYYGPDLGASPDGAYTVVKNDGTTEMLVAAWGSIYRVDPIAGTKTAITGGSYTAGLHCEFLQIRSVVLISNGTDALMSYAIGGVISTYTALGAAPTPTLVKAGMTGGNQTFYYQIVAINSIGHTAPSTEASIASVLPRSSWGASDTITLTWTAVTGATRYEIYSADTAGQEVYVGAVPAGTLSFTDNSTVQPNIYIQSPVDDTTTGPKLMQMELSGNRIWGVDKAGVVYFGGTGTNTLAFSIFAGGGYVVLEKGGRETPTCVKHYRDGKGTSMATVFTSSPEGTGSKWQIELVTATVGSTTFLIPATYKLTGYEGTASPLGVVKVQDSLMFPNIRGAYVLGPKPTLLNVLATDSLTTNIRPFWLALKAAGLNKVAGYYFNDRVYWSVPFASTTNDRTVIFDVTRRNLNPQGFTIGFKQYFEYTDANGLNHFVALPTSGTKLIEISESIKGDLGVAFQQTYLTGRIPMSPSHRQFAHIDYLYVFFNEPQGNITIEVLGNEKQEGFISLATDTITDQTVSSNSGWDTTAWDASQWDTSPTAPGSTTTSILTRKIKVNRLISDYQLRITSADVNAHYTILGHQLVGTIVPTQDPTQWYGLT